MGVARSATHKRDKKYIISAVKPERPLQIPRRK